MRLRQRWQQQLLRAILVLLILWNVIVVASAIADAIALVRSVHRKIIQNLFWAAIYNTLAIPVASGALYPRFNILLQPEWAALLMSVSTITVTVNALSLNRLRLGDSASPGSL